MKVLAIMTLLVISIQLSTQQEVGNFDLNSLRQFLGRDFDFSIFDSRGTGAGNSGRGNPRTGTGTRNPGTGSGSVTPRPRDPVTRGPRNLPTASPDASDIRRVKRVMTNLLTREPIWRPRFIQLAFHDCVGGCDGCINLSDEGNRGVEVSVRKAEEIRRDVAPNWSQADVNALLGVAASEVGVSARAASRPIRIPFQRGRRDCSNPRSPAFRNLPMGSITNGVEFLSKEFGLTDRQSVALLGGGHSVGQMHREFSGMLDVQWDQSKFTVDHGYFVELARLGAWKKQKIDNNLAKTHMWTHLEETNLGGTQLVGMLHVDMTMFKRYTKVGSFEEPSCEFERCPNATTHSICTEFSSSNPNNFLGEYRDAFGIMITKGMN